MCGRYTVTHTHKEIMERFGIEESFAELDPRYNVAPSQMVPVVIETKPTEEEPSKRILENCKWGLIPGFVKDARLLKPMINARAETILEKRMFKNALFKRRCLIPADGFYEWMSVGKKRQPVRFQIKDGELFAFAGLYEETKNENGEILYRTCTIITTAPNELVAPVHNRMPVIMKPGDEGLWLSKDCDDPEKLVPILTSYDSEAMTSYRVSVVVNNARSNSPECVEPVDLEKEAAAEAAAAEALAEEKAAKAAKTAERRSKSKSKPTTEEAQQGFLSDELKTLTESTEKSPVLKGGENVNENE
jgi:putative SOS response-associated peptidase YedK